MFDLSGFHAWSSRGIDGRSGRGFLAKASLTVSRPKSVYRGMGEGFDGLPSPRICLVQSVLRRKEHRIRPREFLRV